MLSIIVALWILAVSGGDVWNVLAERVHQMSMSDGEVKIHQLRNLYLAHCYSDVVQQANAASSDLRYKGYRPQIDYLALSASLKFVSPVEAKKLQDRFIKNYPKSPLSANVLFSKAIREFAEAKHEEASSELATICEVFPNTKIASDAKELLGSIRGKDLLGEHIGGSHSDLKSTIEK